VASGKLALTSSEVATAAAACCFYSEQHCRRRFRKQHSTLHDKTRFIRLLQLKALSVGFGGLSREEEITAACSSSSSSTVCLSQTPDPIGPPGIANRPSFFLSFSLSLTARPDAHIFSPSRPPLQAVCLARC
jgi:hypothetical protein